MSDIIEGQIYRDVKSGGILTIDGILPAGEKTLVYYSLDSSGETSTGSVELTKLKGLIGRGLFKIGTPHKGNIKESSSNKRYELHYSDGIRQMISGDSASVLIDKISMKEVDEWALYKNNTGFHSTADDTYLVKWWGEGSYWDNISKENPEVLSKKYTDYQQTKKFHRVGNKNDFDFEDRKGDDSSSKQYYDRTIYRESKMLKEYSNVAVPEAVTFMRYEDNDVVTNIKELFKKSDYSDFELVKIQTNAEQFYNVEISFELTDDESNNIEMTRAAVAQKAHKLRTKFFADISTSTPVINATIGAIQIGKGSDRVNFVLTLLMSNTNNRNWVTGRRKNLKEAVETSVPNEERLLSLARKHFSYERKIEELLDEVSKQEAALVDNDLEIMQLLEKVKGKSVKLGRIFMKVQKTREVRKGKLTFSYKSIVEDIQQAFILEEKILRPIIEKHTNNPVDKIINSTDLVIRKESKRIKALINYIETTSGKKIIYESWLSNFANTIVSAFKKYFSTFASKVDALELKLEQSL